jgi:SAM-dependent methyltransferase
MSGYFDRQYKKHGLEKVQRYLLDGLRGELPNNSIVLDIGCGVGALHLALLKEGAARAVGVEISDGMLEKARAHASALGFSDKTAYVQGDFVERSPEVPESDVAMLDKVVCCYPDLEALLAASTNKARHLLAITHPRNNVFAALLFKSHIACARLFKLSFHPFWHNWRMMHRTISSHGFQLIHARSTILWQALVYRRIGPVTSVPLTSQSAQR